MALSAGIQSRFHNESSCTFSSIIPFCIEYLLYFYDIKSVLSQLKQLLLPSKRNRAAKFIQKNRERIHKPVEKAVSRTSTLLNATIKMKAFNIIISFLLITGFAQSQTIVSTAPQNKKAIFEEFGGYKCEFCPSGHNITELLELIHQEDFIPINIQAKDYAIPNTSDPDLRSDYGDHIADQTGLIGYPAGTINRHVFPGLEQGSNGTTAINRNNWNEAVELITATPAPVNIAAQAEIDLNTGELHVLVEFYYTANSAASENRLHLAILQDSIIAPQLNNEYWDQEYVHRHVLRDLITGQEGELIEQTTSGTFESRTYTYPLPPLYRNIILQPQHLEVVAFITEDEQEILNGVRCTPTVELGQLDAHVLHILNPDHFCGQSLGPRFILRNDGLNHIENVDLVYQINGSIPQYFSWEGNLCTYEYEEIELPAVSFQPNYFGQENDISVQLVSVNEVMDANDFNNTNTTTFKMAPITETTTLKLDLFTDYFGFETYWEILDANGSLVASGGNQNVGLNGGGYQNASPSNPGAYPANQLITEYIELPAEGCYEFRVLDDYGDGMCCSYGNGFYNLQDEDGNSLFFGGDFEVEDIRPFEKGNIITNTTQLTAKKLQLKAFPNPGIPDTPLQLQFEWGQCEGGLLQVFSPTGSAVFSARLSANEQQVAVPIKSWTSGIYFIQLQTADQTLTRKWVLP